MRRPLLVLGSTQTDAVVDAERARRNGVEVVRRRSGGGAVLLLPGAQVWADLWVPRGDTLWSPEPRSSAVAAGEWWAKALGDTQLEVHRGASVSAAGSDAVCFAGLAAGEVHRALRKVVGLAQWRSREGALVHGCAYRRWDPEPLVDLLAMEGTDRRRLLASLREAAEGFEELAPRFDEESLIATLPEPGSWDLLRA